MAQSHDISESNLNARNPHRALAAHVEEFGEEVSKELYRRAKYFNQQFFYGQLSEIFIEIAAPASPAALATHQPRTPEGVVCVIRIAPSVVAAGENLANDALLHEMIHVWQTETDNRELGYQGHGPKFAAKCNEIGAFLNLPEVACKGKGGKPDCAQWPLNVRPDGYYGSHARAVKSVTRARKAKGSRRASSAAPAELSLLEQALAAVALLSPTERQLVGAVISADGATIH